MAKIKVPGLNKASGKMSFDPLVDGDYLVQVTQAPEIAPSRKGGGENWKFRLTVLDGPFQDKEETVSPDGRVLFDNKFVMNEDHPSYEKYGHIGINQLKNMVDAFGVTVSSSDNIDPSDFVTGKPAWATVRTEVPTNDEGEKGEPRNVIKKYTEDEE